MFLDLSFRLFLYLLLNLFLRLLILLGLNRFLHSFKRLFLLILRKLLIHSIGILLWLLLFDSDLLSFIVPLLVLTHFFCVGSHDHGLSDSCPTKSLLYRTIFDCDVFNYQGVAYFSTCVDCSVFAGFFCTWLFWL